MKILVRLSITFLLIWFSLQISGCSTTKPRKLTEPKSTLVHLPKYDRKLYKHWIDADGDCQNTRAEVLITTSRTKPKFKTAKQCVVISGTWFDPYSGRTITNARELDIDHILTLKSAHMMGASQWSKQRREEFANDPENLVPVSLKLNRQKGAKDPSQWLPPNQSYQCEYINRWLVVQQKYGLTEPIRTPSSLKIGQIKTKFCTPIN